MSEAISRVRSAAIDGRAQNPFYRKTQLKKLHDTLVNHAADIQKAMAADTGHRPAEVKLELSLALQCLAENFNSIDPKQYLADEYAIANSRDAPLAREPVGIVVIEPSFHCFVYSLVSSLAPALKAGNCIVIELEQTMLKTPRHIIRLVEEALDNDILAISHKKVTDAEIRHQHVRVMQKGSSELPLVHHLISRPDARVIAIVERDADLKAAAQALVRSRFSLSGKSPYAPDVVLVNEWVKKDFLAAAMREVIQYMDNVHGTTPGSEPRAVKGLFDQVSKEGLAKIVSSGSHGLVLDIEDRASFLMNRKLQEACLAVHAVTSMDDAIQVSSGLDRLAASYVFTATPSAAKYICQFLNSEVSFVNQVPSKLLFGPIAPSGKQSWAQSLCLYDAALFSLPKPQYITKLQSSDAAEDILGGISSQKLQKLENEVFKKLPEIQRVNRGGDIGFFTQGIVTGGILLLSTAVGCSAALCFYAVRAVRQHV